MLSAGCSAPFTLSRALPVAVSSSVMGFPFLTSAAKTRSRPAPVRVSAGCMSCWRALGRLHGNQLRLVQKATRRQTITCSFERHLHVQRAKGEEPTLARASSWQVSVSKPILSSNNSACLGLVL